MSSKYKSGVFAALLAVFAVAGSPVALASRCSPAEELFKKTNFDLDIRQTVDNFNKSFINSVFTGVAGSDITTMVNCEGYYSSNPDACKGTPKDECDTLANQIGFAPGSEGLNKFAQSKVAGSLLGLGYVVHNYNTYQPLPVNLAYYWNDTVSRIPLAGKVMAAQVTYNNPMITSMLSAWKVSRKVAYALMSIVLLVVGFMIVTRRRLSQQAVVTIQYALPKLVISLILIAFSYPIGATLAGLGWSLNHSAAQIVKTLYEGTPELGYYQAVSDISSIGIVLILLVTVILAVSGVGTTVALVLAVILIIIAGLFLYYQLRVLLVFLKMLFSILSAPIEFMIGAIPGNEDRVVGWFKRMFAYMVTLFFMGGVVTIVNLLAISIMVNVGQNNLGLGVLMGIAAPLFIVMYGYGLAIGMEKRVSEVIMGPPPKKR